MTQEEHTLHVALNRTAPPPAERLGAPYLEVNGTYSVHNRYLRIIAMSLTAVILLMSAAGWRFAKEYADRKPLVIRVDADGQVSRGEYSMLDYKLKAAEVRYFLRHFVIDHYSLNRATAVDAFQRKLYFFAPAMSAAAVAENKRTSALANFIATGTEEVDVEVYNISLEQLEAEPYKASVNFDKVFRSIGTKAITKRERHVMHVQFTMLKTVPFELEPFNYLGFQINYLRSDQAFDLQPSLTAAPSAARPAAY